MCNVRGASVWGGASLLFGGLSVEWQVCDAHPSRVSEGGRVRQDEKPDHDEGGPRLGNQWGSAAVGTEDLKSAEQD